MFLFQANPPRSVNLVLLILIPKRKIDDLKKSISLLDFIEILEMFKNSIFDEGNKPCGKGKV